MKRVLTAVILISLVILALFKAPLWLFTLLVFGVAVLAAHEYFGIVKAQGYRPFVIISFVLLALSFVDFYVIAKWIHGIPPEPSLGTAIGIVGVLLFCGLPVITFLAPLVLLLAGLHRESLSQALPDAALSYMMLPYIGFTLGLLPVMQAMWNGPLFVLYLMLLVWCGDIAAYYVGRAVGKHKLAPRVSPGKSWEGAIASVLGAVVAGLLLFHYVAPIANALRFVRFLAPWNLNGQLTRISSPMWLVVLFAIVVNVSAQLGDLVESALKRGAGVKDSGTLLPGHGGVLDRIDALLFALPVGMIFYLAGLDRYFSAV